MRHLLALAGALAGCGRVAFEDTGGSQLDGRIGTGDASEPTCAALTDVLLCDSFEGSLALWPSTGLDGGTVAIDGSQSFRGRHALRAHGDPKPTGQMKAFLTESTLLSSPPPQLFIRAYLLTADPRPMDQFAWAALVQSSSPYDALLFSYQTSEGSPYFANDTSGATVRTNSTFMMPFGRWVCLEWEVDLGVAGAMRAWVDDVEIADLSVAQQTQATPPVMQLWLGLYFTSTSVPHDAYDVWVDDVIIDDARVGCAK